MVQEIATPPFLLLMVVWNCLEMASGNFSQVIPHVDSVPPEAWRLQQALDWNFDLRWNTLLDWDVRHSKCWGSDDLGMYYNGSVQKKWEMCRTTAAYLNANMPKDEHMYKSATGAVFFVRSAATSNVHFIGLDGYDLLGVNDDYTYNEARGENMAKDLLNGLPDLVYTKLMSEYRKCSSLYQQPLSDLCSENLEFARCHLQAFNAMCDDKLEKREPFFKPSKNQVRNETFVKYIGRSIAVAKGLEAQDTKQSALALLLMSTNSSRSTDLRPIRSPWLTTDHFCSDLCHTACSINEQLYE